MGIVDTLTNFKMQLNIPNYKQNNWFESMFCLKQSYNIIIVYIYDA